MRHAERLVKHIRLRPRLPSECRSDDAVNNRAAARSPTLFAAWSRPSLFAVRIPNYRVWKIFMVYSIIRILQFYFITCRVLLHGFYFLDSLRTYTAHEYFKYFMCSHMYGIKMRFLLLYISFCGFLITLNRIILSFSCYSAFL